ncbi:MAG TPA: metalloregulator ArsR/SmtB family transcription factor [Polyangiaceae bacterium]
MPGGRASYLRLDLVDAPPPRLYLFEMPPREAPAASRLEDAALLRALKALADPTRLGIVERVARVGELSCGQVVDCFDMSQPTISHHVKILTDAGLLVSRSEGKHHFVSVDHGVVTAVAEELARRLAPPKRR